MRLTAWVLELCLVLQQTKAPATSDLLSSDCECKGTMISNEKPKPLR